MSTSSFPIQVLQQAPFRYCDLNHLNAFCFSLLGGGSPYGCNCRAMGPRGRSQVLRSLFEAPQSPSYSEGVVIVSECMPNC